MCNDIIAGKFKTIIECHDVEGKPEWHSAIGNAAIASQVRNLILLMLQYSTHLPGRLTYNFRHGHVRTNRHAYRQHVRNHTGSKSRHTVARCDRKPGSEI